MLSIYESRLKEVFNILENHPLTFRNNETRKEEILEIITHPIAILLWGFYSLPMLLFCVFSPIDFISQFYDISGYVYLLVVVIVCFIMIFLIYTAIRYRIIRWIRLIPYSAGVMSGWKELFKQYFSKISDLIELGELQNIEIIMEEVGKINNQIFFFDKYIQWITEESKNNVPKIISSIIPIINLSLGDVVDKIMETIDKNKILLENAKSEVEKTLSGTPELLEVSEAQKLRLDRQIEQFEELQKRLERM